MKRCLIALFVIALAGCNNTPDGHNHVTHESKPIDPKAAAEWRAGLGNHFHPVSTSNPEAHRAFEEGMILTYAFNHAEAIRAFERAAELDPKLAMAHWGIALALGPNYNIDVTPENEKKAYEHVQTAIQLSANAPQPEKDYIKALSLRYSNEAKPDRRALNIAYRDAMKQLTDKYPDDLDAATLYAESMMLLRPWKLWNREGEPAEGTEQIVATLDSVLSRNPDHVGANHLYIHAIEASNHADRALEAAGRLPGLSPSSGHLVHMPSHIYQRVGDYEAASNSNVAAIEADEEYFRIMNPPLGEYGMMYYPHNIHFLSIARGQEGRSREALAAATKLVNYVGPHVKHMPAIEGFMPTWEMLLVRFEKWDDVLKSREPDKSMATTHALWRFARGMAMITKDNPAMARREYDAFVSEWQAIPKDAVFSMVNDAHSVLRIADKVLAAKLALAATDSSRAISLLEEAIKYEDALVYTEPPDWIMPCREMLGGVLLRSGRAAEAEKVFRKDLTYNRRSGRSLFGLMESLKAQGKDYDAKMVQRQFQDTWGKADVQLSVAGL